MYVTIEAASTLSTLSLFPKAKTALLSPKAYNAPFSAASENKWTYDHSTGGHGGFFSRNAVRSRPNQISSSAPLAQPAGNRTGTGLTLISFQELVKIAASSQASEYPNDTATDHPSDSGDTSEKLLKPSPPPQYAAKANLRSSSPGSSTTHLLPETRGSLSKNTFPQSGTREEPILIDDLMDKDDREPSQQVLDLVDDDGEDTELDEDFNLMQYPFCKNMRQTTPEEGTPTAGDQRPKDAHRRSLRGVRTSAQCAGFLDGKKPVDNMLEEISDIWNNVQAQWMELYSKPSMKIGNSMGRFNTKICKADEKFRLEGICPEHVRVLARDWDLVHQLVYSRIERRSERRLMNRFKREMRRLKRASKVLKNCDPTTRADVEDDNENDMDWTPNGK
ncbi:uncharacterized protein SETTUDRAFT_19606 [Exserohilum turcica Et28A]|uniref:Uncharacterized protein n=1 Tax=Exserohilum turcicum (strain 28A) TaxID=671987 RepID=R0IQX9_EXST2|nr:uncharacterized protein SETTUDRAFT_19606 [Exserohilum turcica Et28A]EOA87091.1 hypothetical protein SETTUDRAFT_19606 [Exserohilum turcica Et28A]